MATRAGWGKLAVSKCEVANVLRGTSDRVLCLRALLIVVLALPCAARASLTLLDPSFQPRSVLKPVRFGDRPASSVVFAGRDAAGQPHLGLLRMSEGTAELREIELPQNTVAIDIGPAGPERDAVFVLTTRGVLRLDAFGDNPSPLVEVPSIYRGTSLAGMTSSLDFARDIDGDGVSELIIPDFDVLHLIDDERGVDLPMPMRRRSYGTEAGYSPSDLLIAPGVAGNTLHAIRGNQMFSFANPATGARVETLPMGISDELLRAKFYSGDDDIDQADVVLREVEQFDDVSGDGVPDITTLETISAGVFDKTTIYRVHLGRVVDGALSFDADAALTMESRGYQVGTSIESLNADRMLIVASSIKVGVGALISALFSRAVTLRTVLQPLDTQDADSDLPETLIKSRIRFNFDSGRAVLPTIKFGDLDGDGNDDLLLKSRSNQFVWRPGTATGRFDGDERSIALDAPAAGGNVVLADLTGDGRAEIVAFYGAADYEALRNRIGVFQPDIE